MSTPHSWSDVINAFLGAVQNVLYEVGNFLSTNAAAIATAVIGLGVAFGIYSMAKRAIPFLSRFLGGL